jgi:hypothetical protein
MRTITPLTIGLQCLRLQVHTIDWGCRAALLMCQHARQLGATAIISMRYDATELMPGLTEVLCYGTAVVVREDNNDS